MHRRLMLALVLALPTSATARQKPPVVVVQGPPPIQLTEINPDEVYGTWRVSRIDSDMFWAVTKNDAGSAFGMICTSGSCVPFFNPQIACEDKQDYPTLMNAPSGAYSAVATCTLFGKYDLLLLNDSTATNDAMTIGGELGIAFPMKSGQFAVSRFSLTGALRATARAQQLSRGYKPAPATQPSRDDTRL